MRTHHIIPLMLVTALSGAQALGAQAARVAGVVFDSVNRRPLGGAEVELVDAAAVVSSRAKRARTDSLGRFDIGGLAKGRYLVGFYHPLLDSLSLESPTIVVSLAHGQDSARVQLAVPSLAAIARALCPTTAGIDSLATLFGRVFDAEAKHSVDSGAVTLMWNELQVGAGGVTQRRPRVTATTESGGAFTFCGVPTNTDIGVSAAHGADSTDLVVMALSERGIIRRDFFVGRGDRALTDGSPIVRGLVRANDGRPLPNVSVRATNAAQVARTGNDGRYELRVPPVGTRTLEFRLLGYAPLSAVVDLHTGALPVVDVKMLTVKQVMDTVRVTATRVFDRDRNGFAARRRAGQGYYFAPADVERLRPMELTQLLLRAPGVHIDEVGLDRVVTMRNMFGGGGRCVPAVFIDNMRIDNLDALDINSWVRPEELDGLEVYTSAERAPMQFTTLNGCGSIVIWTRVPSRKP